MQLQLHGRRQAAEVAMSEIYNRVPVENVPVAEWRKSSRNGAHGNRVEVAQLPTGEVALRNSRDPLGPALVFGPEEMAAFINAAKNGEFDLLASDAAQRFTRPNSTAHQSPPSYHAVGAELKDLAEAVAPGDITLDRESAERLLRMLGALELLHRIHRVDSQGRCQICRTKPRLHWPPSSRPDVCSVYAALNLYMGRSLLATPERSQVG
jgi:hypothetical protein